MPTIYQKKVHLFVLLCVYIVAHGHGICIIRAVTKEKEIEMENDIITINHHHFGETTAKLVRETAKAVLLVGNASEAWFPKSAINSGGDVADWFTLRLEHQFLWQAPYTEAA